MLPLKCPLTQLKTSQETCRLCTHCRGYVGRKQVTHPHCQIRTWAIEHSDMLEFLVNVYKSIDVYNLSED